MDKQELFEFLKKQPKSALLDLLRDAFDAMTGKQQRAVFGDVVPRPVKTRKNVKKLLAEIEQFRRDSLAKNFYAPFDVNSKNYRDIPEETDEWCDLFARFAGDLSKLTANGDHAHAVIGFAALLQMLEAMERGDDIIFADEAGSWMIPADEKAWTRCYLQSLAATTTPEEFVAAALPMIERDSYHSFFGKVYASAVAVATAAQKARLQAKVKRQNIRVR